MSDLHDELRRHYQEALRRYRQEHGLSENALIILVEDEAHQALKPETGKRFGSGKSSALQFIVAEMMSAGRCDNLHATQPEQDET